MSDSIRTLSENEVKTLATTIGSVSQGSALTVKSLQPVLFLKDVVDAAKNQMFFINFCPEIVLPSGTHQLSIPKRKKYLGSSGVTYDTSEPTNGDISVTSLDNMDGVSAIPTPKYSGVALSNYNLRVNALNLLQWAKDDLSYAIGDKIDKKVATVIGDATLTTSSVGGAQTLYGGDATGDDSLANGDVITTDLVAKMARYLKQTKAYYWNSGTETLSTGTKNPWMPSNTEPFVLFIGPAQEETFRKDSQFVNAAEYGSNKVVMNGEIGEYLGIKIIVTNNVESVASGSTGPDGATASADMTRCIMIKARKACTLVWGQKPTLQVFNYPQRDQTWVTLISSYIPVMVQDDSAVFGDVTDI